MKHLILALMVVIASVSVQATTYQIKATQNGKSLGTMTFELLPEVAPKHAAFFAARIMEGFYNGSAFHRVIPGFMIQGGDPNSVSGPRNTWGYGGYTESVVAEFNSTPHVRGIISAARTSDPNSFRGQFFICVATASHLNGQYSVFGRVLTGMDVADLIVNAPRDAANNPLDKISMEISEVATSVNEDEARTGAPYLTLFPQPATTTLSIGVDAPTMITILDLDGRAVKSMQVEGGGTTLDVSALPCGAYVVQAETAGRTVYRPIIIAAP